jgi:N-acetylglucosamine-6-phosphate deacetylase
LPALVDIQLNGYAGVDLNDPNVSTDDVSRMAHAVWATGVGTFFPTVVTGAPERMIRSMRVVREACRDDPNLNASVAGFHVEGPFISPEDGPRGAHRKDCVRPPDWDEFCRWQDASDGSVRLVTLSPEWENAPSFIERVIATGVRVAIGHTKASADQLNAAVESGASLSTHLGNGSHATLPRHPNYIWEQAANDRLWASFIADGHHLPPATFKCLLRAKTLERAILTSDAVSFAGLPSGNYRGWDGDGVDVLPNGRVQLSGTPYLAGAGLPLIRGVENGVRFAGLPLADAVALATTQPAAFFGLPGDATLRVGSPATLLCARWNAATRSLTVLETVVGGQVLYKREDSTVTEGGAPGRKREQRV